MATEKEVDVNSLIGESDKGHVDVSSLIQEPQKKKEPTQPQKSSTPPVTISSKESISSGGFLGTLSQDINQKLQSVSGTSESAPSKSESSKTGDFKMPEAALPATKEKPRQAPELEDLAHAKRRDLTDHLANAKQDVEKDYQETDAAYTDLKQRTAPYTEILNNPSADPLQQQFAQSKLQEMAPEIQKVSQKKQAYDQSVNQYVKTVDEGTKKLKQLSDYNVSYSGGATKSLSQGTADILDAAQGANNFISKYLLGYDVAENGAYSQLADHLRQGADNSLENLPDNLKGKIVGGLAGSIPIMLTTALAPETQIPKFATTMGAIAFGKSYQENKDVLKSIEAGGYGLIEGSVLHGLGIAGEDIGKWAEATKAGEVAGKELTGKAAAALITSIGFGAQDAAKQFASSGIEGSEKLNIKNPDESYSNLIKEFFKTGKINLNDVAASAGTGLAFSLSGIAKSAYEKAFTKTVNVSPQIVNEAIKVDKTSLELRDESAKILEDAVGKSPEDKIKSFLIAKSFSDVADMKVMGQEIANDPAKHLMDIKSSDWSDEQKKQAISNVNAIVDQNNLNIQAAKPLQQEKAELNEQLEAAKLIDNPELRDAKMLGITEQIVDKQAEIEQVLSKPITKTNESESKKTSQESRKEGQEGNNEKGVLTTPLVEGEGSSPEAQTTPPAEESAAGGVLSPNVEEYIHSLPEEEMIKLEKELKEANTSEKEQALKKQFEENSGLKISDEDFRNLGKGVTGVLHDQESTISEPIKPQENAIEKGKVQQGREQEYIGTEAQRVSAETSDSNSPTESGEEQAAKEKVRNIQSLPDEDFVKAFIDSGQLNSVGTQNIRFDIGHIFQGKGSITERLGKAIESIKSGDELTADAKRLKEAILNTKRTGEVPMIEGVGGISNRGNEDIQKFREDIINVAPPKKGIDENAPESVLHQNEKYTINRDKNGEISSIVDSKGNEISPNDGPSELKLFNKISKIAQVKKEGAAAISKAISQSERAENGLAELQKVEPRKWSDTVLKEAEEKVKSGDVNPIRLLNDVEKNPRTLSDTETAILVKHKADMKKEYNNVLKEIIEAKEGENITSLLIKQSNLEEESAQFEKVFHEVIRPNAGRSLAALNMMMKPDYSLFNVISRGKSAEVGGSIPERVKEIYKKQSDKIAELEKRIDENEAKLKEAYKKFIPEFKKTDASKNIRRQKYLQDAEQRKSGRKITKEEIKVERNQILENLKKLSIEQRSTLSANPINAKMIVEIGKLVNNYVKEGIVDFAQIVDNIHLSLKDIVPNVTKEDIENAVTESALKEASDEDRELSRDVLYSKFKLGQERTIDEIKKTSKNRSEANKKIKELEKNSNYLKDYFDKAKKAEIEKKQAEKKIEDTLTDRKDKNRPRFIKVLEGINKGYKALILSGIKTPIKLGSAVVNILALKPAYQGIGNLLSKIPFVGDIYKKAPLQNQGIDEIAKHYSTLATKELFKESYRTLVGKSQFDVKNIDKQYHDSKILGFPGRVHAAIKVFAKLPEYESAKYSLVKQAIKNGEDPFTDPKMAQIEELSVGNALNAVMMDDNKLASLWNNFLLGAQKSESDGIKALGQLLSVEDPIVKVPLNQAAVIWEHIPLLGMVHRIGEIKRGVNKEGGLTPKEANEIARNINRQGLGLLIAGLGALYYKNLGGFQDWRSKKDKKIGIEELGVKINELKLPKILFHNAAWDIAQMAATSARETERGRSGVVGGLGKASVGAAEETIPFVRSAEELAKTVEALKSGKLSVEAGKFVGKLISTSDTRQLAKYIDHERETNPKGFLEAIENDIPGLRRYVSKKMRK